MYREALINAKRGFMLEPLKANTQGYSNRDTAGLKPHLLFDLDSLGGGALAPQNYNRNRDLFSASQSVAG